MSTEYYMSHDREGSSERKATSRWLGRGAQTLGLDGEPVTIEAMGQLAKGYDPMTGDAISPSAGKQPSWKPKLDRAGNEILDAQGEPMGVWGGGHRIGYDVTMSAPKSFSLAFAAADDPERERLLDAHRAAVDKTVGYLEDTLETRRGKAGERRIGIAGMVASGHTHFGNRNLDPQIHEHVLVFSMAQGEDGKWRGWESRELYDRQRMLSGLYRAELAQQVQALGYGVEVKREQDGQVFWDIRGISPKLCAQYSSRHAEVIAYQAEHGGAATQAALATRADKEEPEFPVLLDMWSESLDAAREQDPGMFRSVDDLRSGSLAQSVTLPQSDDAAILDGLQARDAVWTKWDLIGAVAAEKTGLLGLADVTTAADEILARNVSAGVLVEINPERADPERPAIGSARHTDSRYCSRQWIEEVEGAMVTQAQARMGDQTVHLDAATVAASIDDFEQQRGFELLPEQRAAIAHLAQETGGVGIVSGHAGTGKTTMMAALSDAYKAQGRDLIGCSASWAAARKLEAETGMPSVSTARLLADLDNGRREIGSSAVVILDEAGMANSADLARLSAHVHAAQGKLILIGDADQLQPVGAGGGYRLLVDSVGDAKLETIQRQREQADRELVAAFYPAHNDADEPHRRRRSAQHAQGAELLEMLESRHMIDHNQTRQDAITSLVNDYLASPTPADQKIVMAGTRADVATLNQAIRAGLQERGEISKDEKTFEVDSGHGTWQLTVAAGDRIRFGQRDDALGVVNGSTGKIESIRINASGNATLAVVLSGDIDSERGRRVKLDTSTYTALDLAHASTVHRAQGQTREEAYHLADARMTDRHLALVAASRSRAAGGYRLYGAEGDLDGLADRLGMDRWRINALDEGRRADPRLAVSNAQEAAPWVTLRAQQIANEHKRQRQVGVEIG